MAELHQISPEELRDLSQASALRSWAALALEWLIIFSCFYAVLNTTNIFVWVACFVILGRQNYSLLALTHEAGHGHLFKSKRLNDFVGDWLCAAPVTFTLSMIRDPHVFHHAYTLTQRDPDYPTIGVYPVKKISFLRKLVRDILGITNYRGHITDNFFKETTRIKPKEYIPMVVVLSVMFFAFYWLGHPLYFFAFWLVPAATVGVVLFRINSVTEHGAMVEGGGNPECARTIISPIGNFWFAPHNHFYHSAHHLYQTVPFYNLPKLHKKLVERGALKSERVYTSYWSALKEVLT